jgi:hypothetical protein
VARAVAFAVGGLVLAALVVSTLAARSADASVSGTISDFECGDNCYLTIRTGDGEDLTGLCVAETCEPWFVEQAIPQELIGKPVTVTVGEGQQVDASGTVMGDFPAFTTVVVAE